MFPRNDMTRDFMQLARKMVGQNELALAKENAMAVFRQHGGQFDRNMAPVLGACQSTPVGGNSLGCEGLYTHCDRQRLAFAVLMTLSVFETAQEMLVEQTTQRVKDEILSMFGNR